MSTIDRARLALVNKRGPWKPQLPAGEHEGVKIAHHKVGKGYLLVACNREGLHALSACSPKPLTQYGIPLGEVRFGSVVIERQGPLAVITEFELWPEPQASSLVRCVTHGPWRWIHGARGEAKQCEACGFQEIMVLEPCPDCGATALTHECVL